MRKQVFIKCTGLDKQNFSAHLFKMGLIVTKSVFEVSDKGRLKPVSSARKMKGWSAPLLFATPHSPRQIFLRRGPNDVDPHQFINWKGVIVLYLNFGELLHCEP